MHNCLHNRTVLPVSGGSVSPDRPTLLVCYVWGAANTGHKQTKLQITEFGVEHKLRAALWQLWPVADVVENSETRIR